MTRLYAWPVKIEIFVKDRAIVAPRSFPFKFFLQFFPLVSLTCCFFRSSWKPLQGALLDTKCRPLDFFCRFEFTLLTLFVFGFHSRFPFVSHNETGGKCQIDKNAHQSSSYLYFSPDILCLSFKDSFCLMTCVLNRTIAL